MPGEWISGENNHGKATIRSWSGEGPTADTRKPRQPRIFITTRRIRGAIRSEAAFQARPCFPDQYLSDDEFLEIREKTASRDGGASYIPGQSSRGCFAGSGSVSIADNGNVYPCHLFHFDDHLMGNADDDKVGDILFSEKPRGHAIAMDVEPNNDQRSIGRFGFFVERAARRIRCMARVRCSALISIAGS